MTALLLTGVSWVWASVAVVALATGHLWTAFVVGLTALSTGAVARLFRDTAQEALVDD